MNYVCKKRMSSDGACVNPNLDGNDYPIGGCVDTEYGLQEEKGDKK